MGRTSGRDEFDPQGRYLCVVDVGGGVSRRVPGGNRETVHDPTSTLDPTPDPTRVGVGREGRVSVVTSP